MSEDWTRPLNERGNEFNPWAGSSEPHDGRCQAVLNGWRYRYGRQRFCTAFPEHTYPSVDGGSDRCPKHKGRDNTLMRAHELFDTGLEAKTVFHFYDKIHPTKKWLAIQWYEALLSESIYDFQADLATITIDFSGADDSLPIPTDDAVEVDVLWANEHKDAATSLLLAATSKMKMLGVDPTLLMMDMERSVNDDSELDYETGEWNTLEGKDEHHLALPMDRLKRSHGKMLEYGGVGVEDESEANDADADTVVEIYNSPDAEDPLPETLNDEDVVDDLPIQ